MNLSDVVNRIKCGEYGDADSAGISCLGFLPSVFVGIVVGLKHKNIKTTTEGKKKTFQV